MQNTAVTAAAKEIRAAQSYLDDQEDDDARLARIQHEDDWVGGIIYKGNSVSWTHSKAEKYGKELLAAWDELVKLGVPCDGNTSVAEAIAKFCRASG